MDYQAKMEGSLGVEDVKWLAKVMPTEELLEFIFSDNSRVAKNAAWAMMHKKDSDVRQLPQNRLIDLILNTKDISIKRNVLSLVERQEIKEDQMRTDFLDFCLEHMVMLEEPPGVQSLCLKLAYRMCELYPELKHEFDETLKLMHKEFYKPGMAHLINKCQKGMLSPTPKCKKIRK